LDLTAAEAELLAAMKVIYPAHATSVEAMDDRRFEALLEGPRPYWELSQAYSAFRRAQRLESKARSAALRAQLAPVPAQAPTTKPARRPRKPKKAPFVDHAREILAEARAA
jgi:hypothetical protein